MCCNRVINVLRWLSAVTIVVYAVAWQPVGAMGLEWWCGPCHLDRNLPMMILYCAVRSEMRVCRAAVSSPVKWWLVLSLPMFIKKLSPTMLLIASSVSFAWWVRLLMNDVRVMMVKVGVLLCACVALLNIVDKWVAGCCMISRRRLSRMRMVY